MSKVEDRLKRLEENLTAANAQIGQLHGSILQMAETLSRMMHSQSEVVRGMVQLCDRNLPGPTIKAKDGIQGEPN